MKRSLLMVGAIALLLAGLVLGAYLAAPARMTGAPDGSSADAPSWEVVDSLAELLDREVEERLAMADELAALRQRVAGLEAGRAPDAEVSGTDAQEPVARAAGGAREAEDPTPTEVSVRRQQIERFRAAGFPQAEAEYYQRLQEEHALARLYLRDQASREGWLRSDRFAEAMAELPGSRAALRTSMDDATYSRYLYATGQPNHIRVTSVIEGSPAETAGLVNGDVIVRYDGERLYSGRALREASRSGTAGQTVSLEIIRDGDRMQMFMPRGPLGVSISAGSGLLGEP
jgi:hypothetical protein